MLNSTLEYCTKGNVKGWRTLLKWRAFKRKSHMVSVNTKVAFIGVDVWCNGFAKAGLRFSMGTVVHEWQGYVLDVFLKSFLIYGQVGRTHEISGFLLIGCSSANGESFGQTLEGAYKAADEELLDDTLLDCYVLSCPPLRRSSKSLFVGSTGVSVVVSPSTITVAHVGDSRALLVKQGQCEFVTTDHTLALDEEHKRVIAAGGEIRKGMLTAADYRCEYMARRFLTMTRALGDFGFKANSEKKASEQPVISVPDVARLERSNEDNFLIVASDGLWSVMKSEEVALFVYSRSEKGTTLQECCAQLLKECAVARRSADNISIIILSLNS